MTSSALVLLFLSSSLFAYTYFDLSEHLSPKEQYELSIGVLGVLILLLLIIYLFAKKILFPILDLRNVISESPDTQGDPDDEISFISEHLLSMKQKLDEDTSALEDLSLVDTLTGINNRRYLFEFGEKLFKLSKRNKEPLSLIVFDIDHLKNINTKYGNKTGDNILKLLTEVIEQSIRKSDIFARYGGEEFIILLPQTSIDEAQIVAKKIQHTLETPDFKYKAETYFTISVGISSLLEHDIFLRNITQRADIALAKAKENGRNRIEINQGIV